MTKCKIKSTNKLEPQEFEKVHAVNLLVPINAEFHMQLSDGIYNATKRFYECEIVVDKS